jgi:hypothetical protein
MSFPDRNGRKITRLEVSSIPKGAWSVAEEAGALDSVLGNLPKEGFEMRSLASVSFRLNEKDAIARLASYAAESTKWRSELRTGNPAKFYPIVVSLLNTSHAYREINGVFAKRGLDLRVVSVEKVAVEPFSRAGATCPMRFNCKNLLIPSDARIQIDVYPSPHP